MNDRKCLIGLDITEHIRLVENIGEPAYKGKQLYKWIYNRGINHFSEMTDLSKTLRIKLENNYLITQLKINDSRKSEIDGTHKFLFETLDGQFIESVIIPDGARITLCISSQIGCALGCTFCATGKMGFSRNLSAGEILEQVWWLRRHSPNKITNIVFMGMGEPFLNYDNVIKASRILADPEAFAIRKRRITISTVGIVPRIIQYADENHPFSLAVSLHTPVQEIRENLMPIAKKYPLPELMESIKYYYRKSGNRPTYEYILLEGINDDIEHANGLKNLLSLIPCKINLIPYNDVGNGFRTPEENDLNNFIKILLKSKAALTLRKSRGDDIKAACGQLYAEKGTGGKVPSTAD